MQRAPGSSEAPLGEQLALWPCNTPSQCVAWGKFIRPKQFQSWLYYFLTLCLASLCLCCKTETSYYLTEFVSAWSIPSLRLLPTGQSQ